MVRSRRSFAVLTMCFYLVGCTPPGVPAGASFEMNAEGDSGWRWKQTLHSGCVEWLAKANLASVLLSNDPADCDGAPGLNYFTLEDRLVFQNYWSWTPAEYSDLLIFDSEGCYAVSVLVPTPFQKNSFSGCVSSRWRRSLRRPPMKKSERCVALTSDSR